MSDLHIRKTETVKNTSSENPEKVISKEFKDNYLFGRETRQALTLSLEKREAVEHQWPQEVISSEKATCSFRPNNEMFARMSELSKNNKESKKDEKKKKFIRTRGNKGVKSRKFETYFRDL